MAYWGPGDCGFEVCLLWHWDGLVICLLVDKVATYLLDWIPKWLVPWQYVSLHRARLSRWGT